MKPEQIIETTIREVAAQTKVAVQPNMQKSIIAAVLRTINTQTAPVTPSPFSRPKVVEGNSEEIIDRKS